MIMYREYIQEITDTGKRNRKNLLSKMFLFTYKLCFLNLKIFVS